MRYRQMSVIAVNFPKGKILSGLTIMLFTQQAIQETGELISRDFAITLMQDSLGLTIRSDMGGCDER